MRGLRAVLPPEASGPHELACDERSEDVRYREALLEPGKRHVLLAFERAGESFGIGREGFQPDRTVESCVGGREQSDHGYERCASGNGAPAFKVWIAMLLRTSRTMDRLRSLSTRKRW